MNDKKFKKKFLFKNKALTLFYLTKKFKNKINIPEFLIFKKNELKKNINIDQVLKKFNKTKIIIRSSSIDEDKLKSSNAGKYDSLVINEVNFENLQKGIKFVSKKLKSDNDYLIFQEFIFKTKISGVVFTNDINTNAPYYVINFDRSKKTNLITSGKKNNLEQVLNVLKTSKYIPNEFKKLISVIKMIEKDVGIISKSLDIEFAIKNKKVFIFQVRPLNIKPKIDINLFNSAIVNLYKKIKKLLLYNPSLSGKYNALSNMADWNPAEMIGIKSTKLSYSLYSELITDSIWADQRTNYNYKNVKPNRLMYDLAGSPYIDLRTDFNSFLPNGLNKKLETKLINHYIKKIIKFPFLHDKIEFDVIPTCYDFSIEKNLINFLKKSQKSYYINKLKEINNDIVSDIDKNYFYKDLNKIQNFEKEIDKCEKIKLNKIQKIYFLVDVCKKFGTLPFAGIARCAFISTAILKNLRDKKIISVTDLSNFYSNINTITKDINNDLSKLFSKKINLKDFKKKYGHLRPSSYSISSNNYNEGFNYYFSKKTLITRSNKEKKFILKKKQMKEITSLFKKADLNYDSKEFFNFAYKSIQQREYAKYVFMKGIDKIFHNLKFIAKEMKINSSDLEHVSIKTILEANNNLSAYKLKNIINDEIKYNKKLFKISKLIKLPDLIKSSNDVFFHYETLSKGNYITNKKTSGKIKILKNKINKHVSIDDKIIFTENADPGYEFIFHHKIKGLVTKYGGANSHMSIRCMELGIPAIIGIGENNYNFYKKYKRLEINCETKTIINLF